MSPVSFSLTVPVSAAAKPCTLATGRAARGRCAAASRGGAAAAAGPRGRLGTMVEQYDVDELAAAFGLDAQQAQALARHADAILAWPGNITSLRRREEVVSTLLGDSLALLDVPALPSEGRWLDLGSGAGVPGLPLAVALPGVHITLLEAASRKCAFLHEALAAAGLQQRAPRGVRAQRAARGPGRARPRGLRRGAGPGGGAAARARGAGRAAAGARRAAAGRQDGRGAAGGGGGRAGAGRALRPGRRAAGAAAALAAGRRRVRRVPQGGAVPAGPAPAAGYGGEAAPVRSAPSVGPSATIECPGKGAR